MRSHNLATVISYEVGRTLTRRSFWLVTFSVPLLMIGIFAIQFLSSSAAASNERSQRTTAVAFTYVDASGLISAPAAATLGGTPASDPDAARAAVERGDADLFIAYPADLERGVVQVYGRDLGLFDNARYDHVATQVIRATIDERIGDPTLAALSGRGPFVAVTAFADGKPVPGWEGALTPGLFLVVLYFAIIMLGNQMLNITVEEKENRVTEMILTTIDPAALIIGKVAALVLVGLVQLSVVMVPAAILTAILPGLVDSLAVEAGGAAAASAPGFPAIVVDPGRMIVGSLLFLGGFLMFTGLLVAIGSVMPTAKDAGGAFGAVIMGMFLPLYAVMLILTSPESLATQVLTWFPLTAPVTALLRNAVGTLGAGESIGVIALLYAAAALFLALGVRLFRQGSISYGARLPLLRSVAAVLGEIAGNRRTRPRIDH